MTKRLLVFITIIGMLTGIWLIIIGVGYKHGPPALPISFGIAFALFGPLLFFIDFLSKKHRIRALQLEDLKKRILGYMSSKISPFTFNLAEIAAAVNAPKKDVEKALDKLIALGKVNKRESDGRYFFKG
jgi:predicted transcriptional regulator with HTH domain